MGSLTQINNYVQDGLERVQRGNVRNIRRECLLAMVNCKSEINTE